MKKTFYYSLFCLSLCLSGFVRRIFGRILNEDFVRLTTTYPGDSSVDFAWVSLVEDGYWNHVSDDGTQWQCTQDLYSLCTYLTITDTCDYKSIIRIGIYGGKYDGNVDLFSIFSYTDPIDEIDRFFTIVNDWDGSMSDGNGNYGGVFVSPQTDVDNTFYYVTSSTGSSIFNLLDDQDPESESSSLYIRNLPGGGSDENYHTLTETKVGKTSPLFITLANDRVSDETSVYFESETVTTAVGGSLKGSFPKGANIIANFFSDQLDSIVAFDKFEVDYKCEAPQTSMPTSQPTPSCEYNEICTVWGDPHIRTWDSTLYHFMGEGYFDYVKSCDSMNDNRLPFTISARHDYCFGLHTCVNEVIVLLSDGTTISFASNGDGTFKNTEMDATGTYSYIDSVTNELVTYTVKNGHFEILFMYNDESAMLKFEYNKHDFILETSDCLFGTINLCGLCGNINDDETDDFINCETLDIIDNSDSGTAYSRLKGQPWINSHIFGESCCNPDLDSIYLNDSDCGYDIDIPPEADTTCLSMAATICNNAYDKYCKNCENDGTGTGTDETDDTAIDEKDGWIESCEYDFCANDECKILLLDGQYEMESALQDGCLDSSVKGCFKSQFGSDFLSRLFKN